jgi:hypothetical protein
VGFDHNLSRCKSLVDFCCIVCWNMICFDPKLLGKIFRVIFIFSTIGAGELTLEL